MRRRTVTAVSLLFYQYQPWMPCQGAFKEPLAFEPAASRQRSRSDYRRSRGWNIYKIASKARRLSGAAADCGLAILANAILRRLLALTASAALRSRPPQIGGPSSPAAAIIALAMRLGKAGRYSFGRAPPPPG